MIATVTRMPRAKTVDNPAARRDESVVLLPVYATISGTPAR